MVKLKDWRKPAAIPSASIASSLAWLCIMNRDILKLKEPEKLRYFKWWKYEYCPELLAREDHKREHKRQEEWARQFRLPEDYYKEN